MQESQIGHLQKFVQERFCERDGPFVRGLETAMSIFHVQRQAYYSGSFISNHVHQTLQVCILQHTHTQFIYTRMCIHKHISHSLTISTDTLVASLDEIAAKQPDIRIKDEAHAVAEKFKLIFTLFGNCHKLYNKFELTDTLK